MTNYNFIRKNADLLAKACGFKRPDSYTEDRSSLYQDAHDLMSDSLGVDKHKIDNE